MSVEGWILVMILIAVGYCGNRLAEIAAAAEDIQDRLKHVYPTSKSERQDIADEAEFDE